MATVPTLQLVCESKIGDLLPARLASKRWEASGVLFKDGAFWVVFDDRSEIARLSDDLQQSDSNGLLGKLKGAGGYEGIAYDAATQRFYLLVEARKHEDGCYRAVIVECDRKFRPRRNRSVDFEFKSNNKGFEAIAHVQREGQDFLLALCEGNKCKCGAKGRKPGGGRVHVFEKHKRLWMHSGVIPLPPSIPFVDYSGMSLDRGRVAIVSQVNSMLWVGQFDEGTWAWRDAGHLYDFPRSDNGAIRYGNIEGVSWINPTRVVTVSDRRKKSQPDESLSEKDQSVQIFEIPS